MSEPKTYIVCIVVEGVTHYLCWDAAPDSASNYRTTDRSKATKFTRSEAIQNTRYLGSSYDIMTANPDFRGPEPLV